MSKNLAIRPGTSWSGSVLSSSASTLFGKDIVDDAIGPLGLNPLYAPSNPLVDFIFVHGLGGGSRKTWSKTSSHSHFWPCEWLPKDPAFKSVRVHSFGYNSHWNKGTGNVLNIHDFGKSLLGEIDTSPCLGPGDVRFMSASKRRRFEDSNAAIFADSDSVHRTQHGRFGYQKGKHLSVSPDTGHS